MQKNNEELNKAAEDIRKEESYGGFQYKHNYDEYLYRLCRSAFGSGGAHHGHGFEDERLVVCGAFQRQLRRFIHPA